MPSPSLEQWATPQAERQIVFEGERGDPLPNGELSWRDRRDDTIPEGRVGATNERFPQGTNPQMFDEAWSGR